MGRLSIGLEASAEHDRTECGGDGVRGAFRDSKNNLRPVALCSSPRGKL